MSLRPMSLRPTVALLALPFLARVEASCPEGNIGTSNVVFLKPDGTHVKCEDASCPGISGGGGGDWSVACSGAFSRTWRMVSWKGSTVCYRAAGYTYQNDPTQLFLNNQYVETVGQCTGAEWLDSQLTQAVCTCGVPRNDDSTTASGATTIRSTSAEGTSTTTAQLAQTSVIVSTSAEANPEYTTISDATTGATTFLATTSPLTTTDTAVTTTGPCPSTCVPRLGLHEISFHDLMPGGCGFVALLLGAVIGLALACCVGAVIHCRKTPGYAGYGASGHVSVPQKEEDAYPRPETPGQPLLR